MKRLFLLMMAAISLDGLAQTSPYQATPELIIPLNVFSLDSRGTGFFSRQYNSVLEVDLPPNTLKWYYRFLTAPTLAAARQYHADDRGLMEWLDESMEDSTLAYSPPFAAEDAPKVNIYLLKDSSAVNDFTSFISFNRSFYSPRHSMLHASSGWMEVEGESHCTGRQYLGLMNPSIMQEAHILLEVAAIVNQPVPGKNGWTLPELDEWYTEIVNICTELPDSIMTPDKIPVTASCFVNALESRWNAAQFKSLHESEQLQWKNWQLLKCLPASRKQDANELAILSRYIITGLWLTEKGERMRLQYNGTAELEKVDGTMLKGKWTFEQDVFTLEFPGFRTQQYSAAKYSRNELEWKNKSSGRMLRMQRIRR